LPQIPLVSLIPAANNGNTIRLLTPKVSLKKKVYLYADSTCTNCEYLREFSKKFETVLIGYSGAGGKLIHEKNLEVENLVTLSL